MWLHRETFPNGLQVVLVDTASFASVSTLLLVGAGSRYETAENNGIAHFFEHMAFKGSKKYQNALMISSTIEGIGGVFNAFTSKDHTGYWIKATNEHIPTVVDVLSDMVLHSKLEEKEIVKEKGVVIEEINMYEDMPQRKVSDVYEGLMYEGTPLGFDVIGNKKTVSHFSRETCTHYLNQLYHPNNSLLVIAGGLTQGKDRNEQREMILSLIRDKFSEWKSGSVHPFDPSEIHAGARIRVAHKKTEQAHFCMGYPAFSFLDPRKYALSVLTAVLGGGMSSRLFMEVREKRGLCYYIGSGRELYADAGNVVTQAGVAKDINKVKEAMKVIREQEQEIVAHGITQEELLRAKAMYKGRLLLSLEDSFSVANYYGVKSLLEHSKEDPTDSIAHLEKVSLEDVQNVAKEVYEQKKMYVAVIGPFAQEEFIDVMA